MTLLASGVSGQYSFDCNVTAPSVQARNDDLAERLWSESERIAGTV